MSTIYTMNPLPYVIEARVPGTDWYFVCEYDFRERAYSQLRWLRERQQFGPKKEYRIMRQLPDEDATDSRAES